MTKQESTGSVAANQVNLENSKKAEREVQRTQSLCRNCRCRGSVSSLSRVIKYEWYIMTRMTGLDCAVMCN